MTDDWQVNKLLTNSVELLKHFIVGQMKWEPLWVQRCFGCVHKCNSLLHLSLQFSLTRMVKLFILCIFANFGYAF